MTALLQLPITEEQEDELYSEAFGDALFHGEGDELPELPTFEDEEQAQRYLRAYAHYREQFDQVSALFDAEIERIAARQQKELSKIECRVDFLSASLKRFYEASGAKRVVLPHGTLSQRKQPERVVIEDETTFLETAPAELIKTMAAPDKTAIKEHIKTTGEIPTGVDLVRNDPKFTITLAE